ncbi:glycosyl transferase [Aliidongia dinghuensis]|uniref:Glycosyl transferase n=2 Tax=Aliidongia dinghuensis TaxID=1867774 RepID=A0A8J2Z023_9PROT|nr:glycosyl transferase [Aliidongia dinghuensis]
MLYTLTSILAPRPVQGAVGGVPVTVAGLMRSTTGIGEGARMCLAALEALGIPAESLDFSERLNLADMPGDPTPPPVHRADPGGSMIVHINAPYLPLALLAMGRAATRRKRMIGYWSWELPRIPDSWRVGFPFVNEIWVPSSFTADAIRAEVDLPVHVVPHPMLPVPPQTFDWRQKFGIGADELVVGTFFHMGSSFARKNPLAAIEAFRRAFGREKAHLIIKMNDGSLAPDLRAAVLEATGGYPNIHLIEQKLTDQEMSDLLCSVDVLLSMHRTEGFGLPLARAMQLGKLVVATGWSGNLDFMTRENSMLVDYSLIPATDPQRKYDYNDMNWANPSVEHAAHCLRQAAEVPGLRQSLGTQAERDIARQFGRDAWPGARQLNRLGAQHRTV